MNQRASAICFSQKTEDGLKSIGDFKGAKCCSLLRKGIIEAMDVTGISSETRVENVYNLKNFLDEKNDPIKRLQRAGGTDITNELFQMINCSLDRPVSKLL